MREMIIFAPGAKGNELLQNLALRGRNNINMKIMGAGELARYTLMKSGVSIQEEFLNEKEERAIIAQAIDGVDYYGKTTYSDICQITQAVRCMRSRVIERDEDGVIEAALKKGHFREKNDALIRTFQRYMELLKQKGTLDRINLIRKGTAMK